MPKKNGPGCSCCAECIVNEDDFEDASLAANIDQRAGTWTESGGFLRTSDSDSLVIFDAPYASSGVGLQIAANNLALTDELKAVVDYVDDDNYHFALLRRVSSTVAEMEIYKRTGGVDTLLWYFYQDTTFSGGIRLCCTSTLINVTSINGWFPITAHGGLKAGVGTGTIGSELQLTAVNIYNQAVPDCFECIRECVECVETNGAWEMKVVIKIRNPDVTFDAQSTLTLILPWVGAYNTACVWRLTEDLPDGWTAVTLFKRASISACSYSGPGFELLLEHNNFSWYFANPDDTDCDETYFIVTHSGGQACMNLPGFGTIADGGRVDPDHAETYLEIAP